MNAEDGAVRMDQCVVEDSRRTSSLLYRILVTAGGMVAFGLLALLLAGTANAQTRGDPGPGTTGNQPTTGPNGQVGSGVLGTGSGSVLPSTGGAQPAVSGVVGSLVAPVVRVAATAAAPVLNPVTHAAAVLLAPVRPVVAPIVDEVVAPVAAALPLHDVTGPILRAAAPVLSPATSAVGAGRAVSALTGSQPATQAAPVAASPQALAASGTSPVTPPETPVSGHVTPSQHPTASTVVPRSGDMVGDGHVTVPWPGGLPVGPVPLVSDAVGTAAAGPGQSSGGGYAINTGVAVPAATDAYGRAPTTVLLGAMRWHPFGRHHPS
jgi:hypothetical protein